MAIYTVHEPPPKNAQSTPDPERFVFVRDGFYFWAFLLAPLWMLRHRLWLAFLGYIVVVMALHFALRAVAAPTGASVTASILVAVLVGLEAATLRRFGLARRGFRNAGLVVGDDLELAERRFFDGWTASVPRPPSLPRPPTLRASPASPEVIGLFPEPSP